MGNDGTVKRYVGRVIRGVKYPVIPTVYADALSYLEDVGKLGEAVQDALDYLYDIADTVAEQTNAYTDQQIAQLKALLQGQINDVDKKYEKLYNDIVESQLQLTIKVNELYSAWVEYQQNIDGRFQAEAVKLKQYVDSLVLNRVIYVINPVTGLMSTVQVALDDIWRECNNGALTAGEYDRMMLTAGEYDAQGITALEYDTRARWILFFFKRLYLSMISPFTGVFDTYEHVIYQLAQLHKNSLTAEEYDSLGLTAEEYDGKNISAYEYDWNGKGVLTQN